MPVQEEFTMCPFSGGFDFHAVMGDSSEVRDNRFTPFIMVVDEYKYKFTIFTSE